MEFLASNRVGAVWSHAMPFHACSLSAPVAELDPACIACLGQEWDMVCRRLRWICIVARRLLPRLVCLGLGTGDSCMRESSRSNVYFWYVILQSTATDMRFISVYSVLCRKVDLTGAEHFSACTPPRSMSPRFEGDLWADREQTFGDSTNDQWALSACLLVATWPFMVLSDI